VFTVVWCVAYSHSLCSKYPTVSVSKRGIIDFLLLMLTARVPVSRVYFSGTHKYANTFQ
jgi:hypothetical protein